MGERNALWMGLLLAGVLASLGPVHRARAAERELEQKPAPSDVEEIETPLERAFIEAEPRKGLFPGLTHQIQDLPAFFADTRLEARFRTYALRKDRTNDITSQAWAVGGSLYYHSGWWEDRFAIEAEGFTSQSLRGSDGRGGTLLLGPGQGGYSVLGVANAKLRYRGVVLTGYRQELGLPFVNRDDNRMTPNTFEAVTLAKEEGRLRFSTGYIWRIKRRNADGFVSMGEAILAPKERGLAYGSVLWNPREGSHFGVSFGIVPDVLAGVYTEAAHEFLLREGLRLRLDGQLEVQWSVGEELLPGDSVETWSLGLRASTSWEGFVFRLGFAITDEDSKIFSPYGSNPTYVGLMQRDFIEADEQAALLSVSYDFARLGMPGVSAIFNFVEGWGGVVSGERVDAREADLTVDYRLDEIPGGRGLLQNLWLRLRASWLQEDGSAKDGSDFRVILRYDVPIL